MTFDFVIRTWPGGRTSFNALNRNARRWLSEQFGPATPLQLARRAHDAGFVIGGGQ